jgi:hypothetical protein
LGDILHLTAAKTKEAELGDYFYRLNKKWAGSYNGSEAEEISKTYQVTALDYYRKRINVKSE